MISPDLKQYIQDLALTEEQVCELERLIEANGKSEVARERFLKNNSSEPVIYEVFDKDGKVLFRKPEGDQLLVDARQHGYNIRPVEK